MRIFLRILFFSIIILLIIGFYVRSSNVKTGDLLIGLSMVGLFFIWMPLFLYVHWKDKDVKKYWLNSENIKKMQNYEKDKKQEKRDKEAEKN